MNDPSFNDPNLQSFEARLAAMTPQESPARQQELLYHCAFAAGRSAGGKTVRRWQAAVAALAVLLVGMSIPLARSQMQVAQPKPEQAAPVQDVQPQPPMLAQEEATPAVRQAVVVDLDAWQVQ